MHWDLYVKQRKFECSQVASHYNCLLWRLLQRLCVSCSRNRSVPADSSKRQQSSRTKVWRQLSHVPRRQQFFAGKIFGQYVLHSADVRMFRHRLLLHQYLLSGSGLLQLDRHKSQPSVIEQHPLTSACNYHGPSLDLNRPALILVATTRKASKPARPAASLHRTPTPTYIHLLQPDDLPHPAAPMMPPSSRPAWILPVQVASDALAQRGPARSGSQSGAVRRARKNKATPLVHGVGPPAHLLGPTRLGMGSRAARGPRLRVDRGPVTFPAAPAAPAAPPCGWRGAAGWDGPGVRGGFSGRRLLLVPRDPEGPGPGPLFGLTRPGPAPGAWAWAGAPGRAGRRRRTRAVPWPP